MFSIVFIDDCVAMKTEQHKERMDSINIVKNRLEAIANVELVDPKNVYGDPNGYICCSDLVIVDYKLDSPGDNDSPHPHVGSEFVSNIRQKAIDIPIYLLSVEVGDDLEDSGDDIFERYISQRQLADEDFINFEIVSFQNIILSMKEKNIGSLFQVFDCPEYQYMDFEGALPGRVRKYFDGFDSENIPIKGNKVGLIVTVYRWFINEFIRYPGLVYSDQYCAIIMGVTVDYFRKNIAPDLEQCLYNGPFNKTFSQRWWASLILNWLIDKDHECQITGINDQKVITQFLNVKEEDQSKCMVCREKYPESLAYESGESERVLYPVHVGCSHEPYANRISPYFKLPRVIKG